MQSLASPLNCSDTHDHVSMLEIAELSLGWCERFHLSSMAPIVFRFESTDGWQFGRVSAERTEMEKGESDDEERGAAEVLRLLTEASAATVCGGL